MAFDWSYLSQNNCCLLLGNCVTGISVLCVALLTLKGSPDMRSAVLKKKTGDCLCKYNMMTSVWGLADITCFSAVNKVEMEQAEGTCHRDQIAPDWRRKAYRHVPIAEKHTDDYINSA